MVSHKIKPLVTLHGLPAYGEYLEALIDEARRRGEPIHDRSAIVEHSLRSLGESWGLIAPPRTRGVGANQHHS